MGRAKLTTTYSNRLPFSVLGHAVPLDDIFPRQRVEAFAEEDLDPGNLAVKVSAAAVHDLDVVILVHGHFLSIARVSLFVFKAIQYSPRMSIGLTRGKLPL